MRQPGGMGKRAKQSKGDDEEDVETSPIVYAPVQMASDVDDIKAIILITISVLLV